MSVTIFFFVSSSPVLLSIVRLRPSVRPLFFTVSQRITSGTIMYIGQCKEFHGQAVHKLASALQEDLVVAPSGLMKVAVW